MRFYIKAFESVIKLQVHELTKQLYFVGKNKSCHIKVNNDFISNCHLSLVLGRENDTFYYTACDGNILTKKASTNGLFVNKERVEKQILKSGDIINFFDNAGYPYLEYIEESKLTDKPTEAYEFQKRNNGDSKAA